MLPFLKPKRLSATIMEKVNQKGTLESQSEEKPVAEELINAIHNKDAEAVMSAMKKIMETLEAAEGEQ